MSEKDNIEAADVGQLEEVDEAPLLLELQAQDPRKPRRDAFADVPPGDAHGRYMISIKAARAANPAGVLIHDLYQVVERPDACDAAKTPKGDASRFNDLAWAIGRGYVQCPGCMPAAREAPLEARLPDYVVKPGDKPLNAAQIKAQDPAERKP